MTPETAIMMLIWLVIIFVFAWFADYCAGRMFAPAATPQPVRFGIWGIALLIALLVLLKFSGLVALG